MKNQTRIVAKSTLLASMLLTLAASANAQPSTGNMGNPGILPPGSSPFGLTYAQWAVKWWQWSFSFPANADPFADTADCSAGQSGQVWFLAGAHGTKTVTRNCTIPAGKAIFFGILSDWFDDSDCPNFDTFTADQLGQSAVNTWNRFVSQVSCTIDGVPVHGLADPLNTPYRFETPPFSYTLASTDNLLANVFGEPCIPDGATIYPAVADGVFLMLAPQSVGTHVIHFIGIVGPVSNPFVKYDITYNLSVIN